MGDRLAGEGTGKIVGINDPILGWVILGVFTTVWALYTVATKELGGQREEVVIDLFRTAPLKSKTLLSGWSWTLRLLLTKCLFSLYTFSKSLEDHVMLYISTKFLYN